MTTVILLGGCFWGLEYALGAIPGVATESGYAGGQSDDAPTYYTLRRTQDAEAVMITCEPDLLREALQVFSDRSKTDPSPGTDPRYRRAVICPDEGTAANVARLLSGTGIPVVREGRFCPAEPAHQKKYEREIGR